MSVLRVLFALSLLHVVTSPLLGEAPTGHLIGETVPNEQPLQSEEIEGGLLAARIDFEISAGKLKLLFTGINQREIKDLTIDGKSVLEELLFSNEAAVEETGNGFVVSGLRDELFTGSSTLVANLADGRAVLSPIITVPSATCTTCAPAIYGSRCGSLSLGSSFGSNPYPCCDNDSNGSASGSTDGNCTWYAWYRARTTKGWVVPGAWGNANLWCSRASADTTGWKVSSTPTVGTIACSASLGHVAWVTAYNSSLGQITVAEMNCKCPTSCVGTGYRSKTYTASSFQYISAKYDIDRLSTTSGGGTWGSILKMDASVAGKMLNVTVSKTDGTAFTSAGTLYIKEGGYQTTNTNRCTVAVSVGNQSKSCTIDVSSGTHPKSFYARYEASIGGHAWVGPITVRLN